MALSRNWVTTRQDVPYVGALKQGTGWNPVHATRDNGTGRNIAPDGTGDLSPEAITSSEFMDDYGYCYEDVFMGYPNAVENTGWETGTYDRPNWGQNATDAMRQSSPVGYPSWGGRKNGVPRGTAIRAQEHGAIASTKPNVIPDASATAGWENKINGAVEEPGSGISDPSQYEIQTSMQQLYRTREGSQISGTANEYNAPIKSRVVGQKLRIYSGQDRHYDMMPKAQEQMVRPFWLRTAGTGRREDMLVNEMYVSEPLNRDAPPDPYAGAQTPGDGATFGYVSEDATW